MGCVTCLQCIGWVDLHSGIVCDVVDVKADNNSTHYGAELEVQVAWSCMDSVSLLDDFGKGRYTWVVTVRISNSMMCQCFS